MGDAELHTLPLSNGWALWKRFFFRSAGFPIQLVAVLETADAAEAEKSLAAAEEHFKNECRRALASLPRDHDASGRWRRIRRALAKGRVPEHSDLAESERRVLDAVSRAGADLAIAESAYAARFEADLERASRRLRKLFDDDRFYEALLWQNASAARLMKTTAATEPTRTGRWRRAERTLTHYVQRYACKNDSVGFFGPMSWQLLDPQQETLLLRGGSLVPPRTHVAFEHWALEAIAALVPSTPAIENELCPDRKSYVRVDGHFESPAHPRYVVTPEDLALLRAADGTTPARVLAERVARELGGTEEGALAKLRALRDAGLVEWAFELPLRGDGETVLRAQLEALGPDASRARAVLEELSRHRRALEAAVGSPEEVERGLGALAESFEAATGSTSTREHGTMYAARQLVYFDASRDCEVRIGTKLIETLAEPLALVLQSASWLCEHYADACHERFLRIHLEQGGGEQSLTTFWLKAQRVLSGVAHNPRPSVVESFQARWLEILKPNPDARREVRSASELRDLVRDRFPVAFRPGWMFGRHQAPDVMLAADGPEALLRGDYAWVLGELHMASVVGDCVSVMRFHPDPDGFLRALESELERRFVLMPPRRWRNPVRTMRASSLPVDHLVTFGSEVASTRPPSVLKAADLDVFVANGRLTVRHRSRDLVAPLIELLADSLFLEIVSDFQMLPARDHCPRLAIDKLVIQRESWSVDPTSEPLQALATAKSSEETFRLVRRWARSLGAPRRCFYKSPLEQKPVFVDMDSALLVDAFARALSRVARERPGARVRLSEMLPGPGELWFRDDRGAAYTSELRLLAVAPYG